MPARKMRIELFDSEGNRYSVAFEGQMTRDKVVRLLDLVELLGGVPADGSSGARIQASGELTKYERVWALIQRQFPLVWFSSREIQSTYEQEHKQPIGLSTVATYLARIVDKGGLMKTGAANSLKYRVVPNAAQIVPKPRVA